MIDLQRLADKFNEEIGLDKFVVYLNTDVYNEDIGNRNAVIMNVSRMPMGYTQEEFDAESMIVTLTFDLPVDTYGEDLITRDVALFIIADKLLGRRTFTVDGYELTCFFEQQPAGNPYPDEGRLTQQISISGTVLVQNTSCGAIVGNDIKTYIDDNQLLKVARSSSMQYGSDNNIPLSESKVQVHLENISKACTKSLTFIYTGKEIEKEFIRIAEGSGSSDINKIYRYKVEYPGGVTVEVPFKILSIAVMDEPGVYLKYSLSVQTVEEETS